MGSLLESFYQFGRQTKEKVFGWGDEPLVSGIVERLGGVCFGWGDKNTVRGTNFRFQKGYSCFDLYIRGEFMTTVEVGLVGQHNCINVLGVISFLDYLGEDIMKVKESLKSFKGTKRRFQIQTSISGVTFIDDYAHHPTEIKAVLKAARLLEPKRVVVILQPHRFSRVRLLKDEFSRCLQGADEVMVTDIYGASEEVGKEPDILEMSNEIGRNISGSVRYVPKDKLIDTVPGCLKRGDLVLGLGAGDINIIMQEIIHECKKDIVAT
jgi:UDP-N-acetylmuramate--alanine ligase